MIKKLKTIISQYKIFILLAALIPILGFLLIWRQTTKEPPTNPVFGPLPAPETEYKLKTKEEISFQFSLPQGAFNEFPQQLSVYQVKVLSDQEIVNRFAKLATEIGFSSEPTIQASGDFTYYIWQEGDNYLKVDSQTGQFILKGSFPLALGEITPQEAESLIKEKLASWELTQKDVTTSINYFAMTGMELEPVTNPNLATLYEFVFSLAIDGYPLIGFGPAQDVVLVWVTKEGQLIKLNYFLRQLDQEKIGTYPVKTANVVLGEVQNGQGQILNAKTQDGVETNVAPNNPIKTVNLTSVKLVYYESVEKQAYFQPLYLFSGTATLEDDTLLEVSLYLPAISSEWLIQISPTPASKFKIE